MNNLQKIKQINKYLIKPDGTIKSFHEQLLEFEYGKYPSSAPLVIHEDSSPLNCNQLELNDYPIVINQSTIRKIKSKHSIDLDYLINIGDFLRKCVLVLQSKSFENSLLFITDSKDSDGNYIINSLRKEKMNAYIAVNEINSIYGKEKIHNLIQSTFDQKLKIYPNEKTEQWLISTGFQFAQDVNVALSINNSILNQKDCQPVKTLINNDEIIVRAIEMEHKEISENQFLIVSENGIISLEIDQEEEDSLIY